MAVVRDAYELSGHELKVGGRLPSVSETIAVRTDRRQMLAAAYRDAPQAAHDDARLCGHCPGRGGIVLGVALFAFVVYCWVDLARAERTRYLPKWLWAIISRSHLAESCTWCSGSLVHSCSLSRDQTSATSSNQTLRRHAGGDCPEPEKPLVCRLVAGGGRHGGEPLPGSAAIANPQSRTSS